MSFIKEEISKILSDASNTHVKPEDVKNSPTADFGVPIGFMISKKTGKKPAEAAKEIMDIIGENDFIENVVTDKGYVNFNINYTSFTRKLFQELMSKKTGYGKPAVAPSGKILLEHTSVNPSGPIHVGRLRNTVIGDSLRRILSFYGYTVETHYYVNDIGKQIAIIAMGYEEDVDQDIAAATKYAQYGIKKDFQIFFRYVTANKLYNESKTFKEKVDDLIKQAESGDINSLDKITQAARKALEGQKETFHRLGAEFDFYDFESEDLREGRIQKVLRRIHKSEIAIQSDIGKGVDLSKWGIEKKGGFTVLERADGTSVYLARDVTYHLEKLKLGGRLINVLGEDHKLQAQELKIILEQIFNVVAQIDVVHFSFVNFEGEKFSTRKGEIASVDMLLDEALEKARNEITEREIGNPDDAELIGIGAVKFSLLKTVPTKQITFNWDEALSFDGDSAPYIQYAYARSARILEKSGINPDEVKLENINFELENQPEKEIVKKISEFPEVIQKSVDSLRPDLIIQYLLDLTSDYGRFYMNCPVLDSEETIKNRRIIIVKKTKDIIQTGLNLLGISSPEKM